MGKFIPNKNTWVGFAPTVADIHAPTATTEVSSAVDLTPLVTGINASAQGNAVPTPAFDTLFETSIIGTSQATFTIDLYRDDDDAADLGWTTLTRGTTGFFIIARYGGKPAAADPCEVWPVVVLSRAMANETNNTVVSFTVTCAVPEEPAENATVA